MRKNESVLILGVGPEEGLGVALCKTFANAGYDVFGCGRNKENMKALGAMKVNAGSLTGITAETKGICSTLIKPEEIEFLLNFKFRFNFLFRNSKWFISPIRTNFLLFFLFLLKAFKQTSGPIPAGSPGLIAIRLMIFSLFLQMILIASLEVWFLIVLETSFQIKFYKLYFFEYLMRYLLFSCQEPLLYAIQKHF